MVKILGNLFGTKNKSVKATSNNALTLVKYVYMDIVGFTFGRSVEAQSEIISVLNSIICSVVDNRLPQSSVTYIPVGDGICIAMFGDKVAYDTHISIALDILAQIFNHNHKVERIRQFEVRIGINQNEDNIITDINGNRNVIGAGVNFCQRIMSFADGSQILVGQSVFDSLNYREKYMGMFHKYVALSKHNMRLDLFQYIDKTAQGINCNIPSEFVYKEVHLSKLAAYYLAHCIRNRNFILQKRGSGQNNYALNLLFWYLAKDSVGESESTLATPYDPEIIKTAHNTMIEQFNEYMGLPFSICFYHGDLALNLDLGPDYYKYFEDRFGRLLVNKSGQDKLKSEWPSIWNEFGLENIQDSE